MTNPIYKDKVARPFQRSLVKAGALVVLGCSLHPFSKELSSLIGYTALGAFVVVAWYSYRVKKRVKHATFKKGEASKSFHVKTEDGIEMQVPVGHKDLSVKEAENGDVVALLAIGIVCSSDSPKQE